MTPGAIGIDEKVLMKGLSGPMLSVLRGISVPIARVVTASGLLWKTSCSGLKSVQGSEIRRLSRSLI